MKRHAALLLIAASATLCLAAHGQPAEPGRAERVAAVLPEIDKLYADLVAAKHLPGLVIGVVMDGKLVHTR